MCVICVLFHLVYVRYIWYYITINREQATRAQGREKERNTKMTLEKLIFTDPVNDSTLIIVRDGNFNILASGMWYHEDVLKYADAEIESFTYDCDNRIYVDIL